MSQTETEAPAVEPEAEEDGGTAITPSAPLISLFGDSPAEAYKKMGEIVEVLKIAFPEHRKHFIAEIEFKEKGGGKRIQEHVTIEGWTFVGGLAGLSARTAWTRRVEGEFEAEAWEGPSGSRRKVFKKVYAHGYEAHAEAVTLSGAVLGGSEGLCLSSESRWGGADEYARKSMAQTRARSQAIAGVLRFLVEMAGFKGTPAEEMQGVADRQQAQAQGNGRRKLDSFTKIWEALDEQMGIGPIAKDWMKIAVMEAYGIELSVLKDLDGPDKRHETFTRLHRVLWALEDLGEGPPKNDQIRGAWGEAWPEVKEWPGLPEENEPPAAPEGDDIPFDPGGYGG